MIYEITLGTTHFADFFQDPWPTFLAWHHDRLHFGGTFHQLPCTHHVQAQCLSWVDGCLKPKLAPWDRLEMHLKVGETTRYGKHHGTSWQNSRKDVVVLIVLCLWCFKTKVFMQPAHLNAVANLLRVSICLKGIHQQQGYQGWNKITCLSKFTGWLALKKLTLSDNIYDGKWPMLWKLWAHIYWSCPTNSKTITYRNSVSPQYFLICFIEHGGWSLRSAKPFARDPSDKRNMGENWPYWLCGFSTGLIWISLFLEFGVHCYKKSFYYLLIAKSCNDRTGGYWWVLPCLLEGIFKDLIPKNFSERTCSK